MFAIEELASYLETKGLGKVAETIWLNRLPDNPDTVVVIFQGGGTPQSLRINDYYPSFQIRARSKSQEEAYRMIYSIYNTLDNDGQRRIKTDRGRVLVVKKITVPYFYDIDDNDRANFIMNVDFLTKKEDV